MPKKYVHYLIISGALFIVLSDYARGEDARPAGPNLSSGAPLGHYVRSLIFQRNKRASARTP